MDRIYASKIHNVSDQKCGKCSKNLNEISVKCDICNTLFHHECTKMPIYMCIKYFTTRISYTCEKCVTQKTDGFHELLNFLSSNTKSHTYDKETTLNDVMNAVTCLTKRVDNLTAESHSKRSPNSYANAVRSANQGQQNVIVKTNEGNSIDKQTVGKALSNVPVLNMRQLHSGDIQLTLPDRIAATSAITNINTTSGHSASFMRLIRPKITILNVDENVNNDDLVDEIKRKNPAINDIIKSDDDAKIIFTKNAGESMKTVIMSVTPQIRDIIMKNGFLYIGLRRCRTYDRYWVTRCAHCLGFNHKTSECRNNVKCGHCAGDHSTSDCTNKRNTKCVHCAAAGRSNTNHPAFSTSCPYFITARNRIIQRTATTKNDQ